MFGSITDGVFEGKIVSPKGSYYVEKSKHYFPHSSNQSFHSVIYNENHVEDPYRDRRQGKYYLSRSKLTAKLRFAYETSRIIHTSLYFYPRPIARWPGNIISVTPFRRFTCWASTRCKRTEPTPRLSQQNIPTLPLVAFICSFDPRTCLVVISDEYILRTNTQRHICICVDCGEVWECQ